MMAAVSLSLLTAVILIITGALSLPDRAFSFPQSTLEIETRAEKNPAASGSRVALSLFDTGIGDSFSLFKQEGDWEVQNGRLQTSSTARLNWHGSVFHQIRLMFETGPAAGMVVVRTAEGEQALDLYAPKSGVHVFTQEVPLPPWNKRLVFLIYLLSCAFFMFLLVTLLLSYPQRKHQNRPDLRWLRWFPFVVIVCVWSLSLLAFWPGVMTLDSIDQWGQAVQNSGFDNHHPAIYAILMRGFLFLTGSPASIAFLQILVLSFIANAGIQLYLRKGLPVWVAGLFTLVFAIWPINLFFPITLWKDVLYGACQLGLFLILFDVVSAQINDSQNRLTIRQFSGMAAAGLGMSLFRHNGLPVILMIFILLIIVSQTIRFQFLKILALIVCLYLLVIKGFYPIMNVKSASSSGVNQVLIHTISAHVAAGTPLSAKETEYLNRILPLEQWIYDPCVINTLWNQPGLAISQMDNYSVDLAKKLWQWTSIAPNVTFKYLRDSSPMIWQIQRGGCYLFRIGVLKSADGKPTWVQPNAIGIKPDSKLPAFTSRLYTVFETTAGPAKMDAIFWRPAIYAYFALFISGIWALRVGSAKGLLISLVSFSQTGVMLLINIAQDVRYQYGVMLIGLFCLPLLFLPAAHNSERTCE